MMINECKIWYDVTKRPEAAESGWYGAEHCWNCAPQKKAEAPVRRRLSLRLPAILHARRHETGSAVG